MSSKKKQREKEYLKRKSKRDLKKAVRKDLENAVGIEEMAKVLGLKLK